MPDSILHTIRSVYAVALMTSLFKNVMPTHFASIEVADFLDFDASFLLSTIAQNQINYVPVTAFRPNATYKENVVVNVVPSDAFCKPGLHPNSLEHTISLHTNLHEQLLEPWTIHEIDVPRVRETVPAGVYRWPHGSCRETGGVTRPVDASLQ